MGSCAVLPWSFAACFAAVGVACGFAGNGLGTGGTSGGGHDGGTDSAGNDAGTGAESGDDAATADDGGSCVVQSVPTGWTLVVEGDATQTCPSGYAGGSFLSSP